MIAAAAALTVTPLAAAGGTAGAWCNQAPTDGLKWVSAPEATFLDAFAEALFPVGSLPGPGGGSAGLAYYLDDLFVGLEEVQRNLIRLGMHGLDHLPLVTHGARFQELPRETATALVETWLFGGGLAELRIDPALAEHVHGFRRGRSVHSAVRCLAGVRLPPGGALVRADIRQMFPSLDHRTLFAAAAPLLGTDPLGVRLTGLLRQWLAAWSPGRGLPMGISVSPMVSNAYLAATVDPWIIAEKANGRLLAAVRYADDFALVTREPQATLEGLRATLSDAKLVLNETKTRVITPAGPWPEPVLGVALDYAGGALRVPAARTSPPRRKPA